MPSFDIFLHLAILCCFTLSSVQAKHFLVETEDSSDDKPEGLNRLNRWHEPKTTTWPDPTTTTTWTTTTTTWTTTTTTWTTTTTTWTTTPYPSTTKWTEAPTWTPKPSKWKEHTDDLEEGEGEEDEPGRHRRH